jgi:hypothetical protein
LKAAAEIVYPNIPIVIDLVRGAGLGVALYSRIAVRVVNSNIVPFWSVGRAVKAIHTACLRTLVPCCYRILELPVFVFWDLAWEARQGY